ncbi:FHA domain-containing protein [candidate division KSB1 bacterium]|nr:FHA domain-containing protein [candidate division KSB1 bacterium]
MKARLFCTTGFFAGSNFEFAQEATIGKKKENAIVLDQPVISGRHARIFFDAAEGCYCLEDVGSRNGTKLDGVRVTQKEKLGDLHIITFAQKFDFIFQIVDGHGRATKSRQKTGGKPQPPRSGNRTFVGPIDLGDGTDDLDPGPAPRNEKTMIEGAAKSKPSPRMPNSVANDLYKTVVESVAPRKKTPPPVPPDFILEIKPSAQGGPAFSLKPGENLIGRSPECEIIINDPSISRRHAALTVQSGRVFLKDLGSKNHTFVDKQAVGTEMEILSGTCLSFGKVEAQLIRKV